MVMAAVVVVVSSSDGGGVSGDSCCCGSSNAGCPKSLEPMGILFIMVFTLYALYVHPDTLRIFSAALPCLCGFYSTYWDRQ
jgi:hypothetical protein